MVAKMREEIGRRRPGSTNVRRDIAFGQGRKVRKDRKTGNIARETVAIMMYARAGGDLTRMYDPLDLSGRSGWSEREREGERDEKRIQ